MISSGASIEAVQRQAAHAAAAMTLDLYGHLHDDGLEALADALDERYAAARAAAWPIRDPRALVSRSAATGIGQQA